MEDLQEKPLRLQTALARAGAASRRASEALITAGRVSVNGKIVTTMGAKVIFAGKAGDDVICLDGKEIHAEKRKLYLALNKPAGFLCASSDERGRPLARSLLPPSVTERVYTVGRLDMASSGLLLFTNDGSFAAKVSHPSSMVEKEYLVESTVPVSRAFIEAFTAGVEIEGVRYKCEKILILNRNTVKITLIEGKNREIRRVFSHFHLHPSTLRRIRIGSLTLGSLGEGRSRPLTESEITSLLRTPVKQLTFFAPR